MNKKNRCSEEKLTLYHYAELSAAQRRDVEMHLQGCPACRAALAEIQTGLAAIPAMALTLDSAQKQRFVEKVTGSTRRRPLRTPGAWGGLAAAGVLAVVIVSLYAVDQTVQTAAERPSTADFEVLEQLELLQELDLLQELELLQELDKLG